MQEYIIIGSIVVLLIVMFYLFAKSSKCKLKEYEISLLSANEVSRDILLKFAKYEKFIYLHGFTRRVLLEYRHKKSIIYRAYYYNLLNGVHLFLEYNPKKDRFNYIFITKFVNSEYVTYNSSYIDNFEDKVAIKASKASIEELYSSHLTNRQSIDKEIVFNRLSADELVYSSYSIDSFEDEKVDKKGNKSLFILLKALLLIAILIPTGYYYYKVIVLDSKKDTIKAEPKPKREIYNIDKELKEFSSRVKEYKELSNAPKDYKKEDINSSFNKIDNYLKSSSIKREIGSTTKLSKENLKDLEALYKWHNGVEKFIPFRDFYSKDRLLKNYKKYANSDFIIIFGNKDGSEGLAYNLKDRAIYEYNALRKKAANKEFYNIYHLLAVVSNAYKTKAFFDDREFINIDIKKYLKVYRDSLTAKDKTKYKKLIAYLKDKATQYKIDGNKRLKLALLEQIDKLYDKELLKPLYTYINSKNSQVKAKAIEIVGKIGDKNSINILLANLKDKSSRVRDFALMALANIVDKSNSNILQHIYPLLNDKSTFVRLSAYKVIEKVANKDSLVKLRERFNKEDIKVKIGIIRAFSKIGTKDDIELLVSYLKTLPPINRDIRYSEYIRGSKPSPIILNYEISKAIESINKREESSFRISANIN